MLEPRLKAELLVQALLRHAQAAARAAYVTRRGDAQSGAVLVKHVGPGFRCTVFQTAFADDGARRWLPMTGDLPVAEAEADAFVARQCRYDEDLWVVEIEAPEGWSPEAP
ncbi:conserved hypothetical protein [uncultured Alphaproteobacteria bacterium]|jgi:GMP synthase (glutamine-hydrolysing)|uniref:DUF1491 family protein n=1 Tax=uncultured Alphaproteobacteria bacterium TaxID=91750 RepID=A0A212K8Z4_9PROT|nr:conserved hypothetical protein [uncultured Alphaproteobacteria bacterium]